MKTKSKFLVTLMLSIAFVMTVFAGVTLMNTAKADTDITSFVTKYTSIRVDGKSGLRFQTVIEGSFDDTYTFGTLLLPEDLVDGELTHEDAKILDVKQTVWADASKTAFNAVLTDIPATADGYNRKIVARGYYQVNGGDYVYATALVRSTAETAAMLEAQGKGDDFTAQILEVALPELTISASALDMVANGKETLTVNTDLPVVWASSKQDVATVNNGVVTAIANGTTVISATLGERTVECTVTVADYVQKDGSELVYTTANPTATRYAKETATVSGRDGVYKYTTTSQDWTNKLAVKEIGHYEKADGHTGPQFVTALNNFLTKGYKYVTVDVLMAKGSQMRISGLETSTAYVENKYIVGNDIVAANETKGLNDDIRLYNIGSTPVTATYADTWYTIVIDYSDISIVEYQSWAAEYSMIMFGGIIGTVYFDNVRYYADGAKVDEYVASKTYAQYDGSELVQGSSVLEGTYTLSNETIGGRTGVYKFESSRSGWGDKLSIKQANHIGTKFNSSPSAAVQNMNNLGYVYVSFDYYVQTGGIVVDSPEYTFDNGVATWVGKTNKSLFATWTDGASNNVTTYKDGVLTTTYSKGNWYTALIKYDATVAAITSTEKTSEWHGIEISARPTTSEPTAVVYIDNVRYYSANPFA